MLQSKLLRRLSLTTIKKGIKDYCSNVHTETVTLIATYMRFHSFEKAVQQLAFNDNTSTK
jgi:hypothetical protein